MGAGASSLGDRGPDSGGVGSLQVLGFLLGAMFVIVPIMYSSGAYLVDGGNPSVGYEIVDQAVEDYIRVGDTWCCPDDPSAASMLQDLGFEAWAGHPGPLEETFRPFFPAPEATEFTLVASWAPRGGLNLHDATLYEPYDAQGMRAGAHYGAAYAERGPAFVIPRLENLTGASTADVHYIPLGIDGAYRSTPDSLLEPVSWVTATVNYTRTAATTSTESTGDERDVGSSDGPETERRDLDQQVAIERAKHVPVAQGPGPGLSLVFEEPDWTSLAGQLPERPNTRNVTRGSQLVVTEDELLSERAIQDAEDANQGELLPGEDDDADNPYPHHSFQIAAGFHGPGWVDTTRAAGACDAGEINTTVEGAYRLAVTVPRDWADATVLEEDQRHNEIEGWSDVLVETLPDGSTELSSLLNLELEVRCPTHPTAVEPGTARWVVPEDTTVTRTFRFHARPPAYANSTDLGFQTIRARLDSLGPRAHQTGQLVFELTQNPGRVHRTVEVMAPSISPETAGSDKGLQKGTELPLAVVMLNGGEEADIHHLTLEGPQGFFVETTDDLPAVEETYPVPAGPDITRLDDGRRLQIEFDQPLTCPAAKACGVLLTAGIDGGSVAAGPLPPPAHLSVLYTDGGVGPYVDRYVRSDDGHRPVPASTAGPGSAIAHSTTDLRPGEARGAYLFSLAPGTDALCDEQDLAQRDRAPWSRTDGGFVYDDGPRETGYPWFGEDPPPGGPDCEPAAEPPAAWRFPMVAHTGATSRGGGGVDSVGRGAYTYVETLPAELTADWRNGVAESGLTGPDQVTAGGSIVLDLGVESLMDQLVASSVSKADIRIRVVDPYNAWEDLGWWGRHLKLSDNLDLYAQRGAMAPNVDVSSYCTADPEEQFSGCNVPPADGYRVQVGLPDDVVLGTHLAIAEVAWQIDEDVLDREEEPDLPDGGPTMWQTAHLIHPFDVVTREGEQAMLTKVGGTAWLRDWG